MKKINTHFASTEEQFARKVVARLDTSVSLDIAQRLAFARAQALSKANTSAPVRVAAGVLSLKNAQTTWQKAIILFGALVLGLSIASISAEDSIDSSLHDTVNQIESSYIESFNY